MSGGAYDPDGSGLRGIHDRRHRFGLTSDSFQRRVVERPLETTDVEINDIGHVTILTSAQSTLPVDGSRAGELSTRRKFEIGRILHLRSATPAGRG